MAQIFGTEVKAAEIVDSEDLPNTLTSQRNSIDRLTGGKNNVIRLNSEPKLDVMGWKHSSVILSDACPKISSLLLDASAIMFATRKLYIDRLSCKAKSSDHRSGCKRISVIFFGYSMQKGESNECLHVISCSLTTFLHLCVALDCNL